MSVAFLFPGQGAEHEGLLRGLPENETVERTLAEASSVLGSDVRALDAAAALRSTVNVQQAMLIAGVAVARALSNAGVRPMMVAGLSIGAFGAAVACGAVAFADALRIVRLRGELMLRAFPRGYGLAVVTGLDEAAIEAILRRVRTSEPVYLSTVDGPRRIVVAGSDAGLDATLARARAEGASRAERLPVDVPSHTPLMTQIAASLREEAARLRWQPPTVAYIGNRGGRPLYELESIREDVATNVAHPVRWSESLEVARELGATVFVEMPPGNTSTRLIVRSFDDVLAISIDDRGLHDAIVLGRRAVAESA